MLHILRWFFFYLGWRTSTRRLLRFSSVVKNIGTADFKPKSRRSDWEWHACHM